MRIFKASLTSTAIILFLLTSVNLSVGQEKYSTLTGTVKGIEGKKWIQVENDEDKALVKLRIGWRTVYSPNRYPSMGERVIIEYLTQKGTPVAYTVTILEKEARKEVSKGIPPTVAEKQKETEIKETTASNEKQIAEQSRIIPQEPVKQPGQSKLIEKKFEPKRVEHRQVDKVKPKVAEVTPPFEKKVEPLQSPKVEEQKEVEAPAVVVGKTTPLVKTKEITKPVRKTIQETRTISQTKGGWLGDIIFYLIPLIIGAIIGSVTHWGKTNSFVNGINKFDMWVINKRMGLKEEEGKGKIKRYWAMPILWICYGITKLSEKIQDEAVRCGVKTAAYLYLVGIIATVTLYAVVFVIVIVFLIIALWITALILGWSDSGRATVTTPSHVNSKDFGDYGSMKRYCKDCSHYQTKDWSAANYECKLRHKTPEFGNTKACSDYKEQFTIGKETNYCDDCAYFGFASCERGIKIPGSKHACEKFQHK